MALYTFKLPDIGEGIAECEIASWKVKVGDVITEDQPMVDMLTDKAAVEIPSPVNGKVVELKGQEGDKIAVAGTVEVAELKAPGNVEVVKPASDAERVAIPAPAKPVVASLPAPVTATLANGMKLIVVEKHDLPLITTQVLANGGGAADPADRAGLNSLTADLMTKGTKTRSATQIANEVEKLGGSISSAVGWDAAAVTLEVKSDQIAPAMAVLADVARNPVFAAEEIERDRAQTIDGVQVQLKNPARLASLVAARTVMGGGPYGHPITGTPTSLKAITRSEVQAAYARTWAPARATLVMVGDITPAAAKALAIFPRIYWIAGGRPKEGGIMSLAPFFPRIVKAYLIGESAKLFADTLGDQVRNIICGTLQAAVAAAAADAADDPHGAPVVLLSPACASYDQFRNFEQRGDAFRTLVRQLNGVVSQGEAA